MYIGGMDETVQAGVFRVIADERRREILWLLAEGGEQGVTALVVATGLPQPAVSKHLAVLREAGVVAVRRQGRERMYSVNAEALRPVHEWAKRFERYWADQAQRIRERAERMAAVRWGVIGPEQHTKEGTA